MNQNDLPKPKNPFSVNTAGALLKGKKLKRIMIICQDETGYLYGTSYGKTKALCAQTGKLLDKYYDEICKDLGAITDY